MFYLHESSMFAFVGLFFYTIVRGLFIRIKHKNHKPIGWFSETMCFFFAFYLFLVASITLFPLSFGISSNMYLSNIERNVNSVPLLSIVREIGSIGTAYGGDSAFMIKLILRNVGGNILLFMPLGALAPICWHRFKSFKSTLLFGIVLSVGIECLQFLEIAAGTFGRAVDIDDVICNGIGTALGYLGYKSALYLWNSIRNRMTYHPRSEESNM
ncbi:VanZ family protein [Sporolactobacillus sp. THM7-7]|nr:VanZ family protein [Sporolactobacillus sp. THM7-7]